MAATVKTLLEHHGELFWGSRKANPGYQFGISLDIGENGLAAQVVYVMSDLDDNDKDLVTPDVLTACYTTADLERNGIVSTSLMDEDADGALGWYCTETSFFPRDRIEALQESSKNLDDYLDIMLEIMLISPEEVAAGMPSLDEMSFFDLLEELEGISELIDNGSLTKPLPFEFHLAGDALFGWQTADEEDFR